MNGCHWNPPAVNLTLAAGQKLRVIIRVTKGSILKVRVVDPVGLGIKSSADQKDLPILMGVWDHHGHFLPVHLTNTKGATRDYQLTVPFDTPLSFQVHSPKVKLSEQGGGALPAAANAAARAASGLNQPSPPQVHRSQSKGIILDRMEL